MQNLSTRGPEYSGAPDYSMSDIWKAYSKAELQELVGPETLERLHTILPALAGNDWDPDQILYKENLAQIFEAFSGARALYDKGFRRSLYTHLPQDRLVRLATGFFETSGLSHSELVERLSSLSWRNRKFAEQAVNELELPDHFLPPEVNDTPAVSISYPPRVAFKVLKDYQHGVFADAWRQLTTPNSRFVIQMPTGSGKTRTAMELVTTWLNQPAKGPVVWLAHSVELCDQALAAFREVWAHVGTYEIPVYAVWGSNGTLPSSSDEVAFVVAGFPKMHSLNESGIIDEHLPNGVTLIVVDEAHKVLAPTYRAVVDGLRGMNTRVLGLTATPGRSAADSAENERLAEFFFQNLVTIDSGSESVIEHLRRRDVLAEVVRKPLHTHQSYELTASDREYLSKFYDLPRAFLTKLGADDLRNVEIIRRLRQYCENGDQTLLFTCSVDQSRFLVAILTYLGVEAAHLDGSTPDTNRHFMIDQFRNGELQVLSNYGVLSTGFDAPKTDVVFIARPTASVVLYSQMIGRGLRGPAIGGTSTCTVVDVKDNIEGLPDQDDLYAFFDDYFKPAVEM